MDVKICGCPATMNCSHEVNANPIERGTWRAILVIVEAYMVDVDEKRRKLIMEDAIALAEIRQVCFRMLGVDCSLPGRYKVRTTTTSRPVEGERV